MPTIRRYYSRSSDVYSSPYSTFQHTRTYPYPHHLSWNIYSSWWIHARGRMPSQSQRGMKIIKTNQQPWFVFMCALQEKIKYAMLCQTAQKEEM